MITIGLFGTCGQSKWRDPFITKYKSKNINYYNPQVDNWSPKNAIEEAKHLAEDEIILFPVTNETYGLGSLSEVGFSILNAINLNKKRSFVVFIADNVNESCINIKDRDTKLKKESLKNRALIKEHLNKLDIDNLYIVNSLEDMLLISLYLYEINCIKNKIKKYTK